LCDKSDPEVDEHIKNYLKNAKDSSSSNNNNNNNNKHCVKFNSGANLNLVPNVSADIKHQANLFGSKSLEKYATNNGIIESILEEPMPRVPEYRYIAKNKFPIPDNIDMFLDRGNL
jgi:hypothetical protein